MTGIAPERPDLAVARVLAGGLDDHREAAVTEPFTTTRGHTFEGYAGRIAHDLADLLNRAVEHFVAIVPHADREGVTYSVEGTTGTHRSDWTLEYDTATGRWHATAD